MTELAHRFAKLGRPPRPDLTQFDLALLKLKFLNADGIALDVLLLRFYVDNYGYDFFFEESSVGQC